MREGAQGRSTGTTQRDGMGREVEGGFRMGNTRTAAKSLQSCPTLCVPMDCSLPGFSVPGVLQARTLEWVAISFSNE